MTRLPRRQSVLLNGIMISVALAFAFPVVYVLLTSLQRPGATLAVGFLPTSPYLGNYEALFTGPRFLTALVNTAINAVGGALLTTLACVLAAYAFSRATFRGRDLLLGGLLLLMMLPGLTNIIPLYRLASDLGLLNSYAGLILAFGALGVPLSLWILKGFFDSVPRDIEESAQMDGAGQTTILAKIMVPMVMPAVAAAFLINLVYNWNNFFLPLMLTTKQSMKVATVALFDYQHAFANTQNELVAAACVVIMLPVLAMFLALRERFMTGVSEGAVKA